jgi:hypothetical protein
LNITSITTTGVDSNPSAIGTSIPVGTASITVNYKFTSAGGPVTRKADVSNFTNSASSGGFVSHPGNTITVDTSGLPAGTYNVKVQAKDGTPGNAQDDEASSVVIVATITVTPAVSVSAANTVYTGSPYAGAVSTGVLDGATDVSGFGSVSTAFYSDAGATNLISAPTNAGTYYVKATFTSDGQDHGGKIYTNASSISSFTIAQAASLTTTIGAGPFTYNGSAQVGGSGTVTGAGRLSTAATSVTYSANADGTGTADMTNAGTYYVTAHYAGDANHLASDGAAVAVTIAKANATVVVTNYSGIYDGSSHTAGVTITGVGGDGVLGSNSVSRTNAGSDSATASISGLQNYNDVSGTATISITAVSLDDFATSTTQGALNLNSNGTVSFAISVTGGIVDGKTVAQLFNGATFTLKMKNGTGGYESIQATAAATVIGDVVYVTLNMKNAADAGFLAQGFDGGETSAAKASAEYITISGFSVDNNYSLSEEAMTRIFKTGK